MSSILTYLSASLLYGVSGWLFWRAMRAELFATKTDTAVHISGMKPQQYVMLVPLAIHGHLLYHSIFTGGVLSFGVGNAVSSIIWLTAVVYWLSCQFSSLRSIQNLIAPISVTAAIAVLIPLILPSVHPLEHTSMPAFKAHLLTALLAYSLFIIAAMHILLMTVLERRLHHFVISTVFIRLPPLLVMERMLFRLIWAGFILLSLTVFSGIVFSEELFGQPVTLTHKNLFGLISWGIFAALLAGRYLYGWRGRKAIRWMLIGFVVLLLAYIGSKFVLEIILGR